ncbi:MAG: hypothetical protein HRU31_19025 [Rhodobacteraceae bacterium]|nr:hypothetical protein [Paracoccaceae bacterium]
MLVQRPGSGDLQVNRRATWEMSVQTSRDTPSFSRLKVLKASDKYRIVTIFSTKTVDFDNK